LESAENGGADGVVQTVPEGRNVKEGRKEGKEGMEREGEEGEEGKERKEREGERK
jgi:hypothetical protein